LANYVLVHGGHGGGNSGLVWDPMAGLLKNWGHKVFAPTLVASGTSSLEDHISEVCIVIEDERLCVCPSSNTWPKMPHRITGTTLS